LNQKANLTILFGTRGLENKYGAYRVLIPARQQSEWSRLEGRESRLQGETEPMKSAT